ncbi:MAG: hypothetical protein E7182_05075 [Erysipelotrichaceae bacterium]|nr:hypothetical protein [Erysipelotrichaceae bacterium]
MNKGVCWFLGMLTGIVTTVGAEAIVVAAVPTKVYTNNIAGTEIVGANIGDRGLLDVIMNIKKFTVDDVPAIKMLLDNILKEDAFGKFIGVDYEAIRNIALTDPELANKLSNAVKITATLKSLNVDLGKFGNLSMFKNWEAANPTEEEIKANPAIFYYQTADGKYARAFNQDGTRVEGVTAETPLYFGNLSEIPVVDLFVHISYRLPKMTVNEFIEDFVGSQSLDPAIKDLIGDKKIEELSTVKADDFKLKLFIDNPDVMHILEDMTGKPRDEITIGDLHTVTTDDVHLVTVIPQDSSSKKLYDLLEDALSTKAEDITIGQLTGIDIDKCHLSTVIDPKDSGNDKLYQILVDVTGKEKEDILVSDLNGIDIGKAKLTSFLKYDGNERLYTILLDVTGETDYKKLTVNALDGANMKLIKLSTFIDPADNPSLYTVILDMVHAKPDPESKGYATRTAETVLLEDMEDLDFSAVRLSSVWGTQSKDTGNAILDVLLADDTVTIGNLSDKIDALTIHQLFGSECFTDKRSEAFVHYDKGNVGKSYVDAYTFDGSNYVWQSTIESSDPAPDNAFYISAKAGVWLLFSYDVAEADIDATNGMAKRFTPSTVTFHDLQSDASSFSDTIGKSRMYQLLSAGVVTDDPSDPYSDLVKSYNLSQVLSLIP